MAKLKTRKKDFEDFRKSFLSWQQKLGMIGYKVEFKFIQIDEPRYADINIDHAGRCATVRFNTLVDEESMFALRPKLHGKHEAIHLLVSNLADLARTRFLAPREIDEAEEDLVRKLELLL